jgi:hypothetical protein
MPISQVMCLRPLTHLLLTALLLTQWVNVNRCPGGCGAAGREARPHVHLNDLVPAHAAKSACGCKRQREAAPPEAGEGPATSSTATSRATPPLPTPPCDDGVLLLSFDLGVSVRAGQSGDCIQTGPEQHADLSGPPLTPPSRQDGRDLRPHTSSPPIPLPAYFLTRRLLV